MLLAISSFFSRITSAGLNIEEEQHNQFRLKSINKFCLFTILVATPYMLIFYILPMWECFIATFLSAFGLAVTIYLNAKKLYNIAKFFLILATSMGVLNMSYFIGFESGFHLYLYTAPLFIFFLFDIDEKIKILFAFGIYVIEYVFIFYFKFNHSPLYSPESIILGLDLYSINMMLNLVLIFLLFRNYTIYYKSLAVAIVEKQKALSKEMAKSQKAALRAERLKKHVLASEYQSLKNQMSPHFLFNSLNVLMELIYINQNHAADFVKELADVYRYILDTRNKEMVELETEVNFIQSFSYLLHKRFDKNLSIKIQLGDNSTNIMVAPLTLQMLIENAIKHNIISEKQPLTIYLGIADDYIIVKNNLQKKNMMDKQSGIGLENIKSRYKYLTDQPVLVEINDKDYIVKIPLVNVKSKKQYV